MCGIVGLVAFDAPAGRAHELVTAMGERIQHRGPDGGGVVAHDDATLGMVRLAIVDVAHGQQPMSNDDGSIVLVFNGEIYNAPALRAELQAEGVRFRTRSDTEVILRLYERDPDHVEERLAGMWAFVVHDRRRRRAVLSRDRFGIKPLFVVDTGRALAFASELRAFDRSLAPFSGHFAIDHSAAHAMLSWSYVPETATIFAGVKRLPLATRLEIDLASGSRTSREYWRLRPSADAGRIRTLDDACAAVEPLLRRAVREHLESDVPIATFLSGGIDSSLVTALAASESSRPVKAFAIGFTDPRFDESPFARETARRIGVDLEVTMLDEAAALSSLGDALVAYDEPFGDTSSIAVNLLCARVAREYKVALGGDGGDEVFAGYKKHLIMRLRQPLAAFPAVRDGLGRALGRIPTRTDRTRGWTELLRTVRRLARGLEGTDAQIYAQLTQVAPLARTAELVTTGGDPAAYVEALRRRFDDGVGTPLQRTLACDLSNTLPNDMLVKVDRASMAHRLEARVPFLDHRLVEYGVGLPERFTLGHSGKVVLRELHERRFGRVLARRKKRGFGVPVETWLRGPLDAACTELFDARRLDRWGVLSSAALSRGGHREWVRRDPMVAWHAFALAAWCEATLGDGPDAVRALVGRR
ncbi:MAG: Asparagine synthetase [Labilithrix sp.]|nr:Asparagine synthetase [Labilithrix sp.]